MTCPAYRRRHPSPRMRRRALRVKWVAIGWWCADDKLFMPLLMRCVVPEPHESPETFERRRQAAQERLRLDYALTMWVSGQDCASEGNP